MCYVVRLKSIVRLKKSSIQSSFKPADLASRDGSKLEEIGVKNYPHFLVLRGYKGAAAPINPLS